MAGASRRSCASPLPAAPGDATEPAARPRRVPRASSERGTQQGACPQCPPVSPVVGTRQGPAAAPCECAGRAGRSGSGGAGAAAPRNSQQGKKRKKKNPSTPLAARWDGEHRNSKGDLDFIGMSRGDQPLRCLYKSRECTGAFPTWKNGAGVALGKAHSRKVPSAFVLLQLAGKEGNSESLQSPPFPVSFPGFRNVK